MDKTYQGPERRKSERINACFTVTYKLSKQIEIAMWLEGKEFSAIMIDLSADGMAILTEKAIPAKALLNIDFTLVNEFKEKGKQSKSMQIEGEVRYSTQLNQRAYRLGILFTRIEKEDKLEIANFVSMTRVWDSSSGAQ